MATSHPKVSPEHEPGGRSMIMPIPNPRRSPPSSRSGRKTAVDGRKRQKLSHSPEDAPGVSVRFEIGDEVPRSTRVLTSQESGSSDQSASKWYSAAAHKATSAPKQNAEIDDDPPFYMSHRAPYIPANFVASTSDQHFGGGGFSRMDSENEDLRGVIDDLTVENKRLKQMIRSRHRTAHASPSDASQSQDRLFEVRMHGLPAEKRRELEFLLKNFASSVNTSLPSKRASTSNASGSGASTSQNPALRNTPTTDSGYASNSTTGKGFLTTTTSVAPPKPSNTKNVQSYLKDIPDTLLPKQNPLMSERAKQALIVRRLEQLFTGRAAAAGVHDQPIQQQEISHSAARADQLEDAKDNRKRKAEGNREARVMPPDSRINLDTLSPDHAQDSKDKKGDLVSRPGSPDQRPTRPLDLDIHRAQVAADNIAYLDHLGLSAPKLGGSSREGESNWMYLNLLTGLAQLHTLNVTPDQIRKAVKKLSKRLELSKDGGKVRWIGGNEATRFATEDEKAIEVADVATHETADDTGTGGTSSKRSKTNSTSNAAETSNTTSDDKTSGMQTSSGSKNPQLTSESSHLQASSSVPTKQTSTMGSSAFDYKPIVYRQRLRADLDDDMRDSDESYDSPSLGSSGLVYALNQSNLNQQNKEEGLITFFNNPFYCSDYSWERDPSNMKPPKPAVVGETLGLSVPAGMVESPLRHSEATYFTTQFAPKPFMPEMLSASQREKFEQSLPVFPELQPILCAGEEETMPLDFDVCGLGGVMPDDNFVLDVKTERVPAPKSGSDAITKTLPFSRRRQLQTYTDAVVYCKKIDLLPSKLPPPSYIFFTSSSSSGNNEVDDEDDDDEDATSDSSSSPMVDEQYPAPPDFLQQFSGSSRENSGDFDDSKSSSEIDMLAIARKEFPNEIAEQERQYMITQPMGAQRAVAGSLAATVGASRTSSSVYNAPAAMSTDSRAGSVSDDYDSNEDAMSDS